jgi:amino acid transporter
MQLLPGNGPRRTMMALCLGSIVCVLFMALSGPLSASGNLDHRWSLRAMWSEPADQLLSGYALLAACAATLLLSARKQIGRFGGGCPARWRIRHAALGLLAALLFVAHTGLRFGRNLNSILALTFLALILAGALAGAAGGHRQHESNGWPRWQSWPGNIHLWLFGVVAVLTAFHVVAVYYF